MKDLFTRVRPQILLIGFLLGAISLYGLRLGAIEVVTGCIGILGALGMKILEDKD